MTLKEELEILRGEPIEVFTGDPMDIPCIETSDPDKLCKNPVVSVHMLAYNHEPYIRQAIEGVMMQKTDFEFELVIGEDASTDKTREICFEYQKRYPNKIRVLWWYENLGKVRHPAGGNGKRNMAHCRGELVAFCEGDDYWIDPLKLQKQVDVMRKYPNVGLVYTNAVDYREGSGQYSDWCVNDDELYGLIPGEKYVFWNIYSHAPKQRLTTESYLRTATTLIRVSTLINARTRYEILSWCLRLGDVQIWLSLASCSDVYGLNDKTAVYRMHNSGACARLGAVLWRDNLLTRIYFNRVSLDLSNYDLPPGFTINWMATNVSIISKLKFFQRLKKFFNFIASRCFRQLNVKHTIAQSVKELYESYCDCKIVGKEWSFRERCPITFGVMVRLLLPERAKRIFRRILRHGEFA